MKTRLVANKCKPSKLASVSSAGIFLRRLIAVLFAAISVLTLGAKPSSASVLAGWDVSTLPGGANNWGPSPYAATTSDPNLTVGGLTRGSGVGTSGTAAGSAWGGNTWNTGSEAAAISASEYVTFTVTANPGYQVTFSTISIFNYRRSGTGPTTGVLQYQIGTGPFVDIQTVNYGNSSSTQTGSLGGIALPSALQNVAPGTVVTLRIVNYGGTSTAGTWYIYSSPSTTASDFEISGTVSPYVPTPTQVSVETASDGSGAVVPAQTLSLGSPITVYSVSRLADGTFYANAAAAWSLTSITGGIVLGDLVPAGDNLSAVFTPHAAGSAVIHAEVSGLNSVDSGVIAPTGVPTNPTLAAAANPNTLAAGATVVLTAAVTLGTNPTSTGLQVTADTSSFGGPTNAIFHDDGINGDAAAGDNIYSFQVQTPSNLTGNTMSVTVNVVDAQSRSASASISVTVLGSFTIFHANDTHARITPHKWTIPDEGWAGPSFEDVGGAVYLAAAVDRYTTEQPNSLFIDGGDISEGNPIGDVNGNGDMAQFYWNLSDLLKAHRGRGIDAVVVGNHDVRDLSYITNLHDMQNNHGVPVISVNVIDKQTNTQEFAPYTTVTVNGTKIGILGYTTQAAQVGASLSDTLEVAACDWNSSDSSKIHIAYWVNKLRNDEGCNIVIFAAHVGHSTIATDATDGSAAALLKDDSAAKVPEIAITGHWHTWASTVWQPESLNYKTIFAESASYMQYLGELNVDGQGRYLSSVQHVIRDAEYQGDSPYAQYVSSVIELQIEGFEI